MLNAMLYKPLPIPLWMNKLNLFMMLVGCKPEGRHTEQHDVFFGIAENMTSLVLQLELFWPEANGKMHIDAWREVTIVNNYKIEVISRQAADSYSARLFFLNLGGYKPEEFEEYHYKLLVACNNKGEAVQSAKQTAFYKHTGFEGAVSHIDDRYGVDVDDVYEIEDILPADAKEKYTLRLVESSNNYQDEWHIGYFKLSVFRT